MALVAEGIYGIWGPFGSGKTSIMAWWTERLSRSPYNVVLTNVKMHITRPNIYFYPDAFDFVDPWNKQKVPIRFWLQDILEYMNTQYEKSRANNIKRDERIKFFVFIDEAWIIFNQHERQSLPPTFLEHMLQIRKYNGRLFFGAQQYKNIAMQFREHVNGVFYFEPSRWDRLPFLKTYWSIRLKQVDTDGKTLMRQYVGKDDTGQFVVKEVPLDYEVEKFTRSKAWGLYDDLYLNRKIKNVNPQLDYSVVTWHIDEILYDSKVQLETTPFIHKRIS